MFGLFYQLAPAANTVASENQMPIQGGVMQFIPIILMVVFMYLLIFLPESKRRKKLQKQIDSLKQGDKIVTLGHIVGTIEFIGEKTVYIKSQDSKLEIAKTGIASILESGKID